MDITMAKEMKTTTEEWRKCFDEILEALGSMYEQYCSDGHSFMSAGEGASYVLAKYGEYKFDRAGRITHYFHHTNKSGEKKKGKWVKITKTT